MDSYKYYIDFASTFGIPYIIMDEGWAKSTRDPFTPNPTINLQELIKYGKEYRKSKQNQYSIYKNPYCNRNENQLRTNGHHATTPNLLGPA